MVNGTAAARSHAASSSSPHPRPRAADGIGSRRSPRSAATWRAAPSAVPESPDAGCTQTSSNPASRQIREFATQLSATPPAIVSAVSPVLARSHRASSTSTSSTRAWTEAARSAWASDHASSCGSRGGAQADQSGTGATKPPSPVVRTVRRSSGSSTGRP